MDERVRLVRKPSGATEFRVHHEVAAELGEVALVSEIQSRGISADEIAAPRRSGSCWVIPVRKKE